MNELSKNIFKQKTDDHCYLRKIYLKEKSPAVTLHEIFLLSQLPVFQRGLFYSVEIA